MITGKSIAKGALVVMSATLLSRLFGFVREMVIADRFGTTGGTDAYLVAFALPSGLAMAVAAAVSAGFIPVLSGYLVNDDRDSANKVASTLINIIFVTMVVVSALAMAGSTGLVKVLAPGFKGESISLTANLIMIMLPVLIFTSLMGIASGFLNSRQHFLTPALGPMIASVVIIGSAVFLTPSMGIKGLAVGTTAGFACQFLVQLPIMYRKGFRYRLGFAISQPGVVRVIKLMVPVLIASLVPSLILIIERGIASGLAAGSISALNYAFRLMQLPLGIFLMAVAVPVFPALAAFAAEKDMQKFKDTLLKGTSVLALIMIPAAAGLIALSVPIVRLLFERGAFEAKDTFPTAFALSFYALALLPLAVRDIFRRGFYAVQNTLTPVIVVAAGFVLNVILDFILVKLMGIGGLALGAALAAAAEAGILFVLLRARLGGLHGKSFVLLLAKLGAASVIMGVLAYLWAGFIATAVDIETGPGRLTQVGSSVVLGLLVYIAAVYVLKVQEVKEAQGMLKGVLKKLF